MYLTIYTQSLSISNTLTIAYTTSLPVNCLPVYLFTCISYDPLIQGGLLNIVNNTSMQVWMLVIACLDIASFGHCVCVCLCVYIYMYTYIT